MSALPESVRRAAELSNQLSAKLKRGPSLSRIPR